MAGRPIPAPALLACSSTASCSLLETTKTRPPTTTLPPVVMSTKSTKTPNSGHVHRVHQVNQNTKGHSNSLPGQLTKYTEHNFSINIKPTKTPNTKPSPKTISFMCSKSTKLKHVYQRQERKPCKQAIDRSHLIQTTRDFSLTRFYSLTRN